MEKNNHSSESSRPDDQRAERSPPTDKTRGENAGAKDMQNEAGIDQFGERGMGIAAKE